MDREFFGGKKVLVMGLGRFGGGVDVTKFAADCGAKVTVTDLAEEEELTDSIEQLKGLPDIEYRLGGHKKNDFEQADIIVVNPAVEPDNEFIQLALGADKFITSQIEIFFELCPAMIIGITGTNGKSTTAALTVHLLKNTTYEIRHTKYENVWLSGNIGNEPMLTALDKIKSNDLVVLEISSFQLGQLAKIRKAPKVAMLMNLTENHLDRHGTFGNYCRAKENIFRFQRLDVDDPAISIFNSEDEIASKWFERYSKDAGRSCIAFSSVDVSRDIRECFCLTGKANLSNLAGAIAVAGQFGITVEEIKSSLPDFAPLPHRLQFVAQINGVDWYNDSIATTPASTIAALEAFEQPKIVIAGGYDKGVSFDKLAEELGRRAKAVILLGQTAGRIAEALSSYKQNTARIEFAQSLAEAVQKAAGLAEAGDVVMLSPACASYDMFDNFEHRGREFVQAVTI